MWTDIIIGLFQSGNYEIGVIKWVARYEIGK